jgi:hypothetical protein
LPLSCSTITHRPARAQGARLEIAVSPPPPGVDSPALALFLAAAMIVAAAVLYYAFADGDSGPPPRTSLASLATVLATATTPGAAAITELMSTGRPHGIEQLRVIGNAARARELRRLRLPLLEIMRTNANDSTLVCACSSVLSVCRLRAPLAGHQSVSHGLRITQVLMYRSTAPALSERRDAVAWAPSFSATAAAVMRADDAATGRAWWCALN